MSARKGKCDNAFRGRQLDSVRKEIPAVVTASRLILVNGHNHPLQQQKRQHRLTGESLMDFALHKECVLPDWKAKTQCKKNP